MFIISASRRTDIPNQYSEWFFERLREGYTIIQEPEKVIQDSKNTNDFYQFPLTPDVVDGIVFWTKNPTPMLERLDELKDFAYYFQFTVTGYDKQLEPNIPDKDTVIVPAFKELAKRIGPEKVIWRYDPIILSQEYNLDYHIKQFNHLAQLLEGSTQKCIIGFLATYDHILHSLADIDVQEPNFEQKRNVAKALVKIAAEYGISVEACKMEVDFSDIGVGYAHCIDDHLFEKILGKSLNMDEQRLEAGCVGSIDIGTCNTCNNGCNYCFANFDQHQPDKQKHIHMKRH